MQIGNVVTIGTHQEKGGNHQINDEYRPKLDLSIRFCTCNQGTVTGIKGLDLVLAECMSCQQEIEVRQPFKILPIL